MKHLPCEGLETHRIDLTNVFVSRRVTEPGLRSYQSLRTVRGIDPDPLLNAI